MAVATLVVAIVAAIAAVGSVIFTGEQIRISRRTAELQVETDVVTRLDQLLFKMADDPDSHPQLTSQAIANMLQVGLTAVARLPGFQTNKESWDSYTED